MINRAISNKIIELSAYFPVVSLTGPRQSGKTTLLKKIFRDLPYVSLEDIDNQILAESDPRTFLDNFPKGAILDEIQKVPDLFSYIQTKVDNDSKVKFILSGSQNFLLNEKITQSLAGRAGILKLLPFSYEELSRGNKAPELLENILFKGGYPRIYDKNIPPQDYYPSYIQTYLERDVSLLKNIGDKNTFVKFIKLCAGRVGQLLNMSAIGNDLGIATNTVKSWLSVLEASYILFQLQPHHKNYNKRLTKMPKLYFYDTGLLCYLLGIETKEQISTHYNKGSIFENHVILELLKRRFNEGKQSNLYFWRDHKGIEIDCIIEEGENIIPIEIKGGKIKSNSYFKNLNYWNKLSGNDANNTYVVYSGNENLMLTGGRLLAWTAIDEIMFDKYSEL